MHRAQSTPGDVLFVAIPSSNAQAMSGKAGMNLIALVLHRQTCLSGASWAGIFANPLPPFNCSVASIPQLSLLLLFFPPPSLFPCKPGLTHAFFFTCFALFHFHNELFSSSELRIPGVSHVCCCCPGRAGRAVLLPLS